jgi:hypothetical protein
MPSSPPSQASALPITRTDQKRHCIKVHRTLHQVSALQSLRTPSTTPSAISSKDLGGLGVVIFFDGIGYTLMLGFIIWMIVHERNIVKRQLLEEVSSGLISQAQYQRALSPWTLTTAGLSGRATSRFYHALGELAHKKEQFKNHGEEKGNSTIIETLRRELAGLAPQAK